MCQISKKQKSYQNILSISFHLLSVAFADISGNSTAFPHTKDSKSVIRLTYETSFSQNFGSVIPAPPQLERISYEPR